MEGYPSRSPERYNLHNPRGERKPPVYTGRFAGFVVRLIHLADMAPGTLTACGSFAEPSGSTPQGAVSVIRSKRAPPAQPCNPQRIGRLPTPDTLLRFGVPRPGRVSPAVGPLSFAPDTRHPPTTPADPTPTRHPTTPPNPRPPNPTQLALAPAPTHPNQPRRTNTPPNARRTRPTKTNRPAAPTNTPPNQNEQTTPPDRPTRQREQTRQRGQTPMWTDSISVNFRGRGVYVLRTP